MGYKSKAHPGQEHYKKKNNQPQYLWADRMVGCVSIHGTPSAGSLATKCEDELT